MRDPSRKFESNQGNLSGSSRVSTLVYRYRLTAYQEEAVKHAIHFLIWTTYQASLEQQRHRHYRQSYNELGIIYLAYLSISLSCCCYP